MHFRDGVTCFHKAASPRSFRVIHLRITLQTSALHCSRHGVTCFHKAASFIYTLNSFCCFLLFIQLLCKSPRRDLLSQGGVPVTRRRAVQPGSVLLERQGRGGTRRRFSGYVLHFRVVALQSIFVRYAFDFVIRAIAANVETNLISDCERTFGVYSCTTETRGRSRSFRRLFSPCAHVRARHGASAAKHESVGSATALATISFLFSFVLLCRKCE
jgi:hypothetical protein